MGASIAAKAQADGYTLFMGGAGWALIQISPLIRGGAGGASKGNGGTEAVLHGGSERWSTQSSESGISESSRSESVLTAVASEN